MEEVDPITGSHPTIRFENLPIVRGPLTDFNRIRPIILADVVQKTKGQLSSADVETLLSEAVYSELQRNRRNRKLRLLTISSFFRSVKDQQFWKEIQSGLVRSPAEMDRSAMLDRVLSHYAQEIGGHFSEKVYQFATQAVPWGFSWLLNAASVKRFLPWGMTQSLQSRIRIVGEVPQLQRLAQQGTVLLVPTHQSNLDSILVGYVIYLMNLPPFAYGAGLNLFSNPVMSFFMGNLGAYTVDRQKTSVLYKSALKNYSARILQEGTHSIFFPGGGRSRNGAIESKLKLGLLGTAIEAQIESYRRGSDKPNVYVVPMVMSYHFVIEALSLIEEYLASYGRHRYRGSVGDYEEPFPTHKIAQFFWKFFGSAHSGVTIRIGQALDVFGNFVDENGRSIGPNGTTIDPKRWFTTGGELQAIEQRDQNYTLELGNRIVDRFHKENTVLSSHLVAFTFFKVLRERYPELDLFRFLSLTRPQRAIPYGKFLEEADRMTMLVRKYSDQGMFHVSSEILERSTKEWVEDGIHHLGYLHDDNILKVEDGVIFTQNMNLLYYYRNRLCGYGISLLGSTGVRAKVAGEYDEKGFLA